MTRLQQKRRPFISLFHHRHGVDVAIIDEPAVRYWKRAAAHDPSREDEWIDRQELDRVYAAAPAMLAALRDARDTLIDLYDEYYGDDESDNEVTEVIDKVIATIKLAEGTDG